MNATETFDFRLPDGLVLKDVNANRFCTDTLFGDDRLVLKLLVIHEVRHSCGCVVPQWQKEPLQKGESSILTIRFTPKGHGYSIQTAIVYHSQSEYPVKLTVRANVL